MRLALFRANQRKTAQRAYRSLQSDHQRNKPKKLNLALVACLVMLAIVWAGSLASSDTPSPAGLAVVETLRCAP